MPDNVSISISADTSKFRAELLLAERSLRDMRKELKAAADEAVRTGDRTNLDALTKSTEEAEANMRRLSRSLRDSRKAHDEAGDSAAGHAKRLATLSDHASTVSDAFTKLTKILAAAAVGIAAAFVETATSAAKATDELSDAAEAFGITTKSMQAMQLVAAQAGAETDTVTQGFARFTKILGQAQDGNKAAVDAFAKLGLYANSFSQDAAGNIRAYQSAAAAIERLGEGGERAAVAAEFFGKGWFKQIEIVKNLGPNLAAAGKTLEKFGITSTKVTEDQSAAYLKSYNTFLFVFNSMKTIIGNILGTALIPLYDKLTAAIGANGAALQKWATDTATNVKPVMEDLATLLTKGLGADFKTSGIQTLAGILQGFSTAVTVASYAVGVLALALAPLATALNLVFGTNFTGTSLLIDFAAALIVIPPIVSRLVAGIRVLWATVMLGPAAFAWVMGGGLATAFGVLTTAVTVFGTALRTVVMFFMTTPWGVILMAIATAAVLIYENWDKIAPLFQALWDKMKEWGAWISEQWVKFWEDPIGAIKQLLTDLGDWVGKKLDEMWQAIVDWAAKTAAKVAAAMGFGGGAVPAKAEGGPVQMAAGGYVSGPGGPTSDSILARLSDGEYVMRARAVERWGPQFMEMLNNLRNPFAFAQGGMVRARGVARFAGGGLARAGGGATVNLMFPGGSFALVADNAIVGGLTREARRAGMLTAGRPAGILQ